MRDIQFKAEERKNIQIQSSSQENDIKKIRIFSESGDIDFIVNKFKHILDSWPRTKFKSAQIKQRLARIPNDKNNPDFYPLKLCSDNLEIMISEVRCGYRGASPDAMIEILKLAGFQLKQKTIDTIYNEQNVNMVIYMED